MTERFTVKDLNIQDNNPNGRLYMLEEQGGVNAFCNIANGLNNKCKRLSDENEQLKQKIKELEKEIERLKEDNKSLKLGLINANFGR